MAEPITVEFRSMRSHNHDRDFTQTVTLTVDSPMDPRIQWFRLPDRFVAGSPSGPSIDPARQMYGRVRNIEEQPRYDGRFIKYLLVAELAIPVDAFDGCSTLILVIYRIWRASQQRMERSGRTPRYELQ